MLQFIIGFIGILWGTVTDIRTREVPDFVNYSLIGFGVGFALLDGIFFGDMFWLWESLAGLGAGFMVGAIMYYTGQWGGGDSKMIMGLGALFGIPLTLAQWQTTPFFVLFLLCTIFVGAAYGLVWMLVLLIISRKKLFPLIYKRLQEPLIKKIRLSLLVVLAVLIIASVITQSLLLILFTVLLAIIYVSSAMLFVVKVVEKECFIKTISTDKLVEGDWVVGEIKKGKKVLVPENCPGLTKKHIADLKKNNIKTVSVKEGIPFVPSFLIAFVIAYVWMRTGTPLLFWL